MRVICDKCKSENITIREGKRALILKCKDCHTEWHIPLRRTLEALKGMVEYRSGPFTTKHPEDADMAVIYKERLPDLFTGNKKEEH